MEMKSGMFLSHVCTFGCLWGSIVIHNTVNIQFPRSLPVNRTDKFQKLLMAVAEHTLPNDFTLQNVKSREQRRCPVSFYSHASLFPLVLFHLVVPVECDQALEFGFFIYAENYGMFRRVKIQPNKG